MKLVNELKTAWSTIERVDPTSPTFKKAEKLVKSLPENVLREIVKEEVKFLRLIAETALMNEYHYTWKELREIA